MAPAPPDGPFVTFRTVCERNTGEGAVSRQQAADTSLNQALRAGQAITDRRRPEGVRGPAVYCRPRIGSNSRTLRRRGECREITGKTANLAGIQGWNRPINRPPANRLAGGISALARQTVLRPLSRPTTNSTSAITSST